MVSRGIVRQPFPGPADHVIEVFDQAFLPVNRGRCRSAQHWGLLISALGEKIFDLKQQQGLNMALLRGISRGGLAGDSRFAGTLFEVGSACCPQPEHIVPAVMIRTFQKCRTFPLFDGAQGIY